MFRLPGQVFHVAGYEVFNFAEIQPWDCGDTPVSLVDLYEDNTMGMIIQQQQHIDEHYQAENYTHLYNGKRLCNLNFL